MHARLVLAGMFFALALGRLGDCEETPEIAPPTPPAAAEPAAPAAEVEESFLRPAAPKKTPSGDFRNAAWQEMRSEIMQIRQAVGIDPLAGTTLQNVPLQDGDDFLSGLDQAADEQPPVAPNPSARQAPERDPSYAIALRAAIAALQAKAERLENASRFAESDRLRAMARDLREEARAAEGWVAPPSNARAPQVRNY